MLLFYQWQWFISGSVEHDFMPRGNKKPGSLEELQMSEWLLDLFRSFF